MLVRGCRFPSLTFTSPIPAKLQSLAISHSERDSERKTRSVAYGVPESRMPGAPSRPTLPPPPLPTHSLCISSLSRINWSSCYCYYLFWESFFSFTRPSGWTASHSGVSWKPSRGVVRTMFLERAWACNAVSFSLCPHHVGSLVSLQNIVVIH